MYRKLFFSILFLLLIVPSVLALSEDILRNCNLSDVDILEIDDILKEGIVTDDNIELFTPFASKCDMSAIPPSAWQQVASSLDTTNLDIDELKNNPNLTSVVNTLAGATICTSLSDYDLVGTTFPSYVPFGDDTFNIYLGDVSLAHLSLFNDSIAAIDCGVVDSPDYTLTLSDVSVLENLTSSDNLLSDYISLKKNEDIIFSGTSFGTKLKVGFLNTAVSVVSWFR